MSRIRRVGMRFGQYTCESGRRNRGVSKQCAKFTWGNQGIDTRESESTVRNPPGNANIPDVRSGHETAVQAKPPPCPTSIQGACPTGTHGPCASNSRAAAPAATTSC